MKSSSLSSSSNNHSYYSMTWRLMICLGPSVATKSPRPSSNISSSWETSCLQSSLMQHSKGTLSMPTILHTSFLAMAHFSLLYSWDSLRTLIFNFHISFVTPFFWLIWFPVFLTRPHLSCMGQVLTFHQVYY